MEMISVLQICKDAQSIGITGHIKPDGDCSGSVCALWQFLSKVYPEKKIEMRLDYLPDTHGFLKGSDKIIRDYAGTVYDVFFVLDTVPEKERIGNAFPYFEKAKVKVNIDHHITNKGVGDHVYVVPEASSTSELIYELIKHDDPELKYMDVEIAKAIYFGIIQDCGVFKYSNTSPKTMRICADLIGYGFDFPTLIDETFYEKTYIQNKVMGYVVLNSVLALEGKVVYGIINREEMEKLGAGDHDFDGIVNQLRYTKGCDVAIFAHQNKDMDYKLSLRSNANADVSKVAAAFNGGGHMRAAGCTLKGDISSGISEVIEEIKKQYTTADDAKDRE